MKKKSIRIMPENGIKILHVHQQDQKEPKEIRTNKKKDRVVNCKYKTEQR